MQNSLPKTSRIAAFAIGNPRTIAPLALGAAAIVIALLILSNTVKALVVTYETNVFNHCFLIIPIALYLGWQRREALAAAVIAPEWRGGIVIAIAAFLWLLGDATSTLIIQEISLVVIIQSLILTIYGRVICRILIFPLLYLFFAIPFGLELIPHLQAVTALLSVALLKLVGVPVFSDGYLISVPNGNWYVADACSGIRYVIASLALGALFAGTMYVTWWRRALVFLIAIIVPIIANGIRAFGIILLAYLTDNEVATGVDHLVYGWLFFTLVSCLVLAIGMSFRETPVRPLHPAAARGFGRVSLWPSLVAASAALVIVGAAKAYGDYVDAGSGKAAIALIAPDIDGFQRIADAADHAMPRIYGADAVLDASYAGGDATLYLRIGYFLPHRRDVRSTEAFLGSGQALSATQEQPGSSAMLVIGQGEASAIIGGVPAAVHYQRIAAASGQRLVWFWYWVDGQMTGDLLIAKLLQIKAKLLGGPPEVGIVALATDYRDDAQQAENSLRDFASRASPLGAMIAHARRP